ncbi:CGNR zinc finger domain-containing protein [Streptomyces mirabilis]|uniref:CGNR zinc finger domain-containing protein n=1 Tax=Streptomyces mirabilis TaxID=68239 RepID=UPI00378CEA95
MIDAYQAQCADSLRRLKSCRNTRCTVTFFDRSRNNSDVWHGVRLCGNAANLRNHRARKRATADTACLTASPESARPYSLTNLGQPP